MPVKRPRKTSAQSANAIDALIDQAGNDPEVASSQEAKKTKAKKKKGKSVDKRYTKTMLYLQGNLKKKLAVMALDDSEDMSDIANRILCEALGVDFYPID